MHRILFFCIINIFSSNLFCMEPQENNNKTFKIVSLENNNLKSLKEFAGERLVKNLLDTKKRSERAKTLNNIMPDLFEHLVRSLPESINLNLVPGLWYLCRSRASAIKSVGKFNSSIISSPCGKYICYKTGLSNPNLTLLNVKTNKILLSLGIQNGPPLNCAFSNCGKFIALARNQEIDIYDNETGISFLKLIHKDNSSFIVNIFWSPCGKYILTQFCPKVNTVFHDQALVLWDLETGDTKSFKHNNVITRASFSSDSRYLLTISGNNIFVYNTASGDKIFELPIKGDVKGLFFSSNNRHIVVALNNEIAETKSLILVYDTQDLNKTPINLESFDEKISSLVFSSVSDQLAIEFANDSSEIVLLNLDGNSNIINHKNFEFFRLSSSGKMLVTLKNRTAIIWDCYSGKRCFKLRFKSKLSSVNFDSNNIISFALVNYIFTIPTPESLLDRPTMKTFDGLEKFFHICRPKPINNKKN